ncbi:hypothetical protein [Streptomyces flavofungini]|uniref:hypothetical protein n=1 Tax=Streptomyces flavofungini TaxID=68200 RepID=UPI0025AFE0D1|nr:hypothetical protein [Streptomyces flavofungini]WJV47524.1 hypothetical protein QUY26_19520 [Streptomyces flavofungini]
MGVIMLVAAGVLFTLALACAVLGIHGLALGRLPGMWLQRHVKQPRVWGAGALLLVVGAFWSATIAVIGIGLLAIGHVRTPAS